MNIYIALVHYPVYNKKGDIVTTSVTTLDVHDISRIGRTYGVEKFFIVTPLSAQRKLVGRMLSHWQDGFGSTYNPSRKEALSTAEVVDDLPAVLDIIRDKTTCDPTVVATSAQLTDQSLSCRKLKDKISPSSPVLLLFGTGWGLTKEVICNANYVLEPIFGKTDFNHLPVRAAVAIVLDRMLNR